MITKLLLAFQQISTAIILKSNCRITI